MIDRVARRVTETATLAAIDEQAVDAADTRSPKQLQVWLLRLVVQLEPLAFAQRHRRALAERRVTVVQGTDGIGYVTGEVSAADAAAIDALLAATARSLGAEDPRTDQQRRADLFADLLLGRITFDDQPEDEADEENGGEGEEGADQDLAEEPCVSAEEADDQDVAEHRGASAQEGDDQDLAEDSGGSASAVSGGWLEVEDIDPDTGELLGTHLQRLDADGQPTGEPINPTTPPMPTIGPGVGPVTPRLIRRPRTIRIGVIVPLASLLDASDAPGELADRSGFIPGDIAQGPDQRGVSQQHWGPSAVYSAAHRQRRPAPRRHRTRPPPLHPARRSHQHPGRQLPIPHLHRARRPVRPGSPPTKTGRRNLRPKHGSVLPPTPPRQNLRLACRPPRRPRRRLDHARRRTLPMHRPTTTHRTSRVAEPSVGQQPRDDQDHRH